MGGKYVFTIGACLLFSFSFLEFFFRLFPHFSKLKGRKTIQRRVSESERVKTKDKWKCSELTIKLHFSLLLKLLLVKHTSSTQSVQKHMHSIAQCIGCYCLRDSLHILHFFLFAFHVYSCRGSRFLFRLPSFFFHAFNNLKLLIAIHGFFAYSVFQYSCLCCSRKFASVHRHRMCMYSFVILLEIPTFLEITKEMREKMLNCQITWVSKCVYECMANSLVLRNFNWISSKLVEVLWKRFITVYSSKLRL